MRTFFLPMKNRTSSHSNFTTAGKQKQIKKNNNKWLTSWVHTGSVVGVRVERHLMKHQLHSSTFHLLLTTFLIWWTFVNFVTVNAISRKRNLTLNYGSYGGPLQIVFYFFQHQHFVHTVLARPAFSVAGLTVFNSLPPEITLPHSTDIFKRHLKTRLFTTP